MGDVVRPSPQAGGAPCSPPGEAVPGEPPVGPGVRPPPVSGSLGPPAGLPQGEEVWRKVRTVLAGSCARAPLVPAGNGSW